MKTDKIVDSKVTTMTDLSGNKSKVLLLKNETEIEAFKEQLRLYSVVVPKGTLPYPYKHQLKRIDQLNQTQTDLKQQLQILRHFANKLGLYDASDYLNEK